MSSTTTSNPPSTWATLSRSPALSAETNWSIHHAESPPIALQYDRAHLNDCTGTHPCEHCDLGCTHSSSGRSTRSKSFKWIKGELLGRGSYGEVYLALNATTGDLLAVKQVEIPKTASDRQNAQQLEILNALKFEGDTLRDLDHPNIVQYLGFEESESHLSVFLEYVPGGTITGLIREHGRLREEVVKHFIYQILDGLGYLHARGIVHRDLKSDNILLEPTGVCKISDFGVCKKVDVLNPRPQTIMKGTVYWMAPEVLLSDGKGYDVSVDIWSIGCLAVEMWSGRRPWADFQMVQVMMKLATEKSPPPLPTDVHLSSDANTFRQACFHAEPELRPSAEDLRKHDYLHLPVNWSYSPEQVGYHSQQALDPVSLIQGTWNGADDEELSTMKPLSDSHTFKPFLPPLEIPDLPNVFNPITLPSETQHLTLDTVPQRDSARRAATTSSSLPSGLRPRLVHITPPSSPKRPPPTDDLYHPASTIPRPVGASASNRKARLLYISNPDDLEVEDARRENSTVGTPTFVYTPPPLPTPDSIASRLPRLAGMEITGTEEVQSEIPASRVPLPASPSPHESSLSTIQASRPLPVIASTFHAPQSSNTSPSGNLHSHRTSSAEPQRQPSPSTPPSSSHSNVQPLPTPPKTSRISPTSPFQRRMSNTPSRSPMGPRSLPTLPRNSKQTSPITPAKPSELSSRMSIKAPQERPETSNPTSGLDDEMVKMLYLQDQAIKEGSTSSIGDVVDALGQSKDRKSRPVPNDVYGDLETWFPHHDLDRPLQDQLKGLIDDAGPNMMTQVGKSIRMTAQEQNEQSLASARRGTLLWDHDLQEIPRDATTDPLG